MKPSDIRQNSVAEIQSLIQELSVQLVSLKFNHTISPVENPARMRQIRKDIARLHTILKEKLSAEAGA